MDDHTINALAGGEPDPATVTDSCGCVFCDIDLERVRGDGGKWFHHVGTAYYEWVECTKAS